MMTNTNSSVNGGLDPRELGEWSKYLLVAIIIEGNKEEGISI